MCDFIRPACLIANLFSAHKGQDHFDLKDIRRVSEHVEKELHRMDLNVMVVWTRPTVMSIFDSYADMFEKRGNTVHKISDGEEDLFSDDFINIEFNKSLPPKVCKPFLNAVKNIELASA